MVTKWPINSYLRGPTCSRDPNGSSSGAPFSSRDTLVFKRASLLLIYEPRFLLGFLGPRFWLLTQGPI